jgi:hypothetical protein
MGFSRLTLGYPFLHIAMTQKPISLISLAFLCFIGCTFAQIVTAQLQVVKEGNFPSNKLPSAAMEILQHADHFELLSLDPRLHSPAEKDSFHGYRVLSRVAISDANTRERLISALRQGMRENSGAIANSPEDTHRMANQTSLAKQNYSGLDLEKTSRLRLWAKFFLDIPPQKQTQGCTASVM